jgi:hypothetical protein
MMYRKAVFMVDVDITFSQLGVVVEGRAGSHQQVNEKLGWKLSQRMR